ncbi:phage tail protein [Burkholderia sp. AU30280]|uniref:phage tail protein n=1 Tax=Burkholderia sp. AU30280 TaxID=2879628 RepID=UPI001CF16D99|nr:phage tail protein [Burkholderia sp. AU30280]MCA8275938.1 phage tail protein [Burkholderia sp. AU30280]
MATQILITDAGRAALVAPGNGGTSGHLVTTIGLANAPFVADKGLTKLPNELKRITTFGGANIAPDTIHATLKDDTADQYSLYGFGLYLENGVLLAAYGQATPIMEKSPAALLLLSTDLQFATIDATQLVFGDASFLNPPATTERQGVVELATQAEVNDGADDTRAVTPKTAASRYAALTGAKFTGPVVTEFDAGPNTAHVTVRPPTGKNGRESRVRLHGTFGGNNADTGTRLIATVRAGFDNGAWGREYVDLWLNKTANDAEIDAYQARAVRITYGGRVLVGDVRNDDGNSRLRVGGDTVAEGTSYSKAASIDGGAGNFSTLYFTDGGKIRWSMFKRDGAATGGNGGNDFGLNAFADDGITQFPAFRVDRGSQVFSIQKRMLVGDVADDGRTAIRAKGAVTADCITLDNPTSAGVTVKGKAGFSAGIIFENTTGATGRKFSLYVAPDGKLVIGDETAGAGRFIITPEGRVLMGTADDNTARLQVIDSISVNRLNGEGKLLLGQNDGYFFANTGRAGWYSPSAGSFQYHFAERTLKINDRVVWHEGNVTPLDRLKGGTMAADMWFDPGKRIFLSEGSAGSPSLTFNNDGAPDTGLYHINDGSFGVTCNSVPQISFTPGGTTFQTPAKGPTPAAGDRSTALATTEWVLAALSTATVGQIVFEPRTLPRAGFLKANGVLVNRADYPALWAYAQASGTLVSDDEWRNERWGCFSHGDGSTTFRLPELRGEFIRCWADGRDDIDAKRAIGSYQGDQNRSHAHGASAAAVGDHAHSAWTDAQGWHGHHGWTAGVGDHQHVSPWGENPSYRPPWGTWGAANNPGSSSTDSDNVWGMTSPAGGHSHEFNTEGAGTHGHNVGIGGAGNHSHAITVNADGGNETRPRNIALLAMIRAY